MDKFSDEIRFKVIELLLEGHIRKYIVRRLGVSGGYVSQVKNSLSPYLMQIGALSRQLRKFDQTPGETIQAVKAIRLLKQIGVSLGQIPLFVQSIHKISKETNYSPKLIVKAYLQILELESASKMKYPQITDDFELKLKQKEKLDQKIKERIAIKNKLEAEITQAKKQTAKALKDSKLTKQDIINFKEHIEKLKYYDIDPNDTYTLSEYLNNMRETNQDPKNFVAFTKKYGSIKQQISELQTIKNNLLNINKLIKQNNSKEQNQFIKQKTNHQSELNNLQMYVESSNKTLSVKQTELLKVQTNIKSAESKLQTLSEAIDETEAYNYNVRMQTQEMLGIQDYASQKNQAITNLQKQEEKLQLQINAKKTKIEFADFVENLLVNSSPLDFIALKYWFSRIEQKRKNNSSQSQIDPQDIKPIVDHIKNKIFPIVVNNVTEGYRKLNDLVQKQNVEICELKQKLAKCQQENSNLHSTISLNKSNKLYKENLESLSNT